MENERQKAYNKGGIIEGDIPVIVNVCESRQRAQHAQNIIKKLEETESFISEGEGEAKPMFTIRINKKSDFNN